MPKFALKDGEVLVITRSFIEGDRARVSRPHPRLVTEEEILGVALWLEEAEGAEAAGQFLEKALSRFPAIRH